MISRRDFLNRPAQGAAAAALLGVLEAATGPAIRIEKDGKDIRFAAGKTLVCRIPAVATADVKEADAAEFGEIGAHKAVRTFQAGAWDVSEQIRLLDQDLYEWRRTWKNRGSETVKADLSMEIESGYAPEFTLIPGISYNGNPEYGRMAVKGLANGGVPWVFSAFRSNIPAGNYSEGGGWSIFVFTSTDHRSEFCSFSLEPRGARLAHRLLWPERDNLPARGPNPAGFRETLEVPAGATFESTAYVVIRPTPEKRRAFSAGMDHAWKLNRHTVKASFPPKRLWELGTQFARDTLWYDKPDFTGFNIGVNLVDGKWVQRAGARFEIGWCGQNGGYATALLQDYIWNKNRESLEKGEKTLDFWTQNGRLKCGLFYTHFDVKLGATSWAAFNPTFLGRPLKPGERFIDTHNLGHGAYQFLLASELAEKCGLHKPQWRQVGMDTCNFFLDHALPDGTYGKAWSLEGECLAPGFTTGAQLILPMLKAYRMTHNRRYLESARRAFRAYLERDLDHMTCTGGALDADTIDREGGVPLLYAALDLYELTGSKEYLRHAELAGYYLASWQWHYSIPFHPESPILELKYDWFAGTGITAMSQSQDPWGGLWAAGWLRLAKATGREIWKDRAVQCFNQGTLGLSDGTLNVKGGTRPPGSQTESYNCALRTADGKRLYGDYRNWLVAWPSAHRLFTLMHWPNWKDFES